MKKIFSTIALLAVICACEKEKNIQIEDNTQSGGKQIITATVNCPTKVTYSENTPGGGAGISSVWAEGDTFLALQDGSTVVTFTLASGAGSTSATFTAEAENVTASTSWKAVLGGHASVHGTEIHCGYTDQGGKLSSLNNYNYVVADGTGLTPSFDFNNGEKLSYIMRIKLPAGIKCIEYTCPAYFKVTGSGAESVRAIGDNESYDNIPFRTITLATASSAGDLLYLVVPAVNHACNLHTYLNSGGKHQYKNRQTGVILTFLNDTSNDATASNGTIIGDDGAGGTPALKWDLTSKGGMVATFDLSAMTLIKRPKPSDAITLSASNVTKTWYNNQMKDKASTLTTHWAPFNIGATASHEVGDFFAWGELKTKSAYTFQTHIRRHQAVSTETNYYDIIAKDVSGTDINYATICGSRYDVARVKWGSAWRMAHNLEFETLNQSGAGYATVSGVTGWKTGDLFFPPAGYYDDSTLKDDSGGYHVMSWSGDQVATSQANATYSKAYAFDPKNGASTVEYWGLNREYGIPVRPVLSSSVKE